MNNNNIIGTNILDVDILRKNQNADRININDNVFMQGEAGRDSQLIIGGHNAGGEFMTANAGGIRVTNATDSNTWLDGDTNNDGAGAQKGHLYISTRNRTYNGLK